MTAIPLGIALTRGSMPRYSTPIITVAGGLGQLITTGIS